MCRERRRREKEEGRERREAEAEAARAAEAARLAAEEAAAAEAAAAERKQRQIEKKATQKERSRLRTLCAGWGESLDAKLHYCKVPDSACMARWLLRILDGAGALDTLLAQHRNFGIPISSGFVQPLSCFAQLPVALFPSRQCPAERQQRGTSCALQITAETTHAHGY